MREKERKSVGEAIFAAYSRPKSASFRCTKLRAVSMRLQLQTIVRREQYCVMLDQLSVQVGQVHSTVRECLNSQGNVAISPRRSYHHDSCARGNHATD